MLAGCPQEWLCWVGLWGVLWKSYTTEYILIREGDVVLHLLPELHYTPCQKAWFTSSRWVSLLHSELKSLGIGHHLLLLEFLDI